MSNPTLNRIDPTSITPTVSRQTPKTEFGQVLANAVGQTSQIGGAFVSAFAAATPVTSAAVSGVQAVVNAVGSSSQAALTVAPGTPANTSVNVASSGQGDAWNLLQAQRDMNMESLNLSSMQSREYLALQDQMQRESREFNAVSNIIKVRHDSAKSAINNIR